MSRTKNTTPEKYKVEKKGSLKERHKYPFDAMEVDDSFLIPNKDIGNNLATVRTNVWYEAKLFSERSNAKFKTATRIQPDGLRVWRVR